MGIFFYFDKDRNFLHDNGNEDKSGLLHHFLKNTKYRRQLTFYIIFFIFSLFLPFNLINYLINYLFIFLFRILLIYI